MDALVCLLKNHQVGIWCKRAAWVLLAVNLARLLLAFYAIMFLSGNIPPLSLPAGWYSLLQALLVFASGALFDFFILYAAGVAVEHLAAARE